MQTFKQLLKAILLLLTLTFFVSVQADGILSKLFGSSSTNFNSLIAHVPADTPYLMANKKPIPEEVMSFHIKRGQEMMKMFKQLDTTNDDKKITGADAFAKALFEDLGQKLADDKFEDTGLSLKATSLLYAYHNLPVVRLTIKDKDKLMATLKNAEEKSAYKIKLTSCGDFDCFVNADPNSDKMLAIVMLKDQLAAAIFTEADKASIIDHLIGKADPKDPYTAAQWDTFLKTNNYTGYGDGFINLLTLFENMKPLIKQGIQQDSRSKMDDKEIAACLAVAQDHLNNMPEIIFGTKNLEAKAMDYELVLKTSDAVSSVLQTIPNPTNIDKRLANPIIDMGININFKALREALAQYANFLLAAGEKHQCKSIKPKEVRKAMGGMMMGMNMGLTQFKSIYMALNDIEIGDKMNPKKVDAFISIGADDPGGLIGMLSMMNPKLAGFQVPADGSVVKLPDGVIPSKGAKLPPIFLSRTAKTLNIMLGNDKPALTDYDSKQPEMLIFGMDGKRYYSKLATIMKIMPQPKKPKDKTQDPEQIAKMMESLGNLMGTLDEEITADKRGLVVNYHLRY